MRLGRQFLTFSVGLLMQTGRVRLCFIRPVKRNFVARFLDALVFAVQLFRVHHSSILGLRKSQIPFISFSQWINDLHNLRIQVITNLTLVFPLVFLIFNFIVIKGSGSL